MNTNMITDTMNAGPMNAGPVGSPIGSLIEGVVIGVLAATAIVYGFQTRVMYPTSVLRVLDHPWVILVLIVIIILVYRWSPIVSALMFLLVLAFIMDTTLFARPLPTLIGESPSEQLSHASAAHALPHDNSYMYKDTDTDDVHGAPLNSISLPTPIYPTFDYDPHETRGGPAPFQVTK